MRVAVDAVPASPDATADLKAHLRLDGDGEDAVIGRLISTAIVACEAFTGAQLLIRAARQQIAGDGTWQRLGLGPVQAITGIVDVGLDGSSDALPADAYTGRIDADGEGWVCVTQAGAPARLLVQFKVGQVATWNELPEPLRQGIIRLAAHLYAHRDAADDGGPPAAVTALWRPWRRMRLR